MFDDLPPAARAAARALDDALRAARDHDADAFAEARDALRRVDPTSLAVLVGAVAVHALERAVPDGLDAETAVDLLERCLRDAVTWFADADQVALVRALTDVLGVTPDDDGDDDAPAPDPDVVNAHGLLLVAELVDTARLRPEAAIRAGLAELRRAQTVELP